MADLNSIINYYEKCYRADRNDGAIISFLGSSVEKRIVFKTELDAQLGYFKGYVAESEVENYVQYD